MKLSVSATRAELPILGALVPALKPQLEVLKPLVSAGPFAGPIVVEGEDGKRATVEVALEIAEG